MWGNCTTKLAGAEDFFFVPFTIKVAFVTLVNTDVFGGRQDPFNF